MSNSDFSYALNMFLGKVGHYMISATGIVAALSWNTTMKEIIKSNFPQPETEIKRHVVYSVMITLLLVLLIWILPTPSSVKSKYDKKQHDIEQKQQQQMQKQIQQTQQQIQKTQQQIQENKPNSEFFKNKMNEYFIN